MDVFEIYAEIPKRLYGEIEEKGKLFALPNGITMSRKVGSRGINFICEGKDSKEELIELLDQKGINWQEN